MTIAGYHLHIRGLSQQEINIMMNSNIKEGRFNRIKASMIVERASPTSPASMGHLRPNLQREKERTSFCHTSLVIGLWCAVGGKRVLVRDNAKDGSEDEQPCCIKPKKNSQLAFKDGVHKMTYYWEEWNCVVFVRGSADLLLALKVETWRTVGTKIGTTMP